MAWVSHQRTKILVLHGSHADNMYRESPVVCGVEAADELIVGGILEIPVCCHVTIRVGKQGSGWRQRFGRVTHSVERLLLERVEVGGNHISAGLVGPFAADVAGRMGMPEGECEPGIADGWVSCDDRLAHAGHVGGPQQAVVTGDKDRAVLRVGVVAERRGHDANRPVDAGGHIVIGRSPEPVEDSHWWSRVALSNSKMEAGVGGCDSWATHVGLTGFRTVRPWAFFARCQMHGRTT